MSSIPARVAASLFALAVLMPALAAAAEPPAVPSKGTALASSAPEPTDHSGHAGHGTSQPAPTPDAGSGGHGGMHPSHEMEMMHGALGSYPMSREASGTSWQPDVSEHGGTHWMAGAWSVMSHALVNGVYDWQDGLRGDEKAFVSGMVMASAMRDIGAGTINLRAMLSPDPFMGKRGYPLLLAAGETADGVTPLVDRQHPHELVMELAGSYAQRLDERTSVFVYAGLPGEPAFGPPAFMHRLSTMDSPEAPISHHWLDSTHITFGVVTAGWVHGNWRLEASGFRGREPDQNRFDIEPPRLDSFAARLSVNPTERWTFQVSWADLRSPEQLSPSDNEKRWSASAIYTLPLAGGGWWSTTAAYGGKDSHGHTLDAFLLESAVHPSKAWTFWLRGEAIETPELGTPDPEIARKFSVGALRDFALTNAVAVGIGALYSRGFVADALEPLYADTPQGAMAFVRLKLGA